MYTYNCRLMEWSGLFTHAVVGYNSFGREFYNHPQSGSPGIIDIACENQERGTPWSNQILRLADARDLIQQQRAQCTKQISEDIARFGNFPSTAALFVQPCPCSIFQARRDRRFVSNFDIGLPTNRCFNQRFPGFPLGSQLCCYS